MIEKIKGISLEYKAAFVLSVLAFFLSLLIGIISGVKSGVVLIRAIFAALIFAGLGFAALHIISKNVPEVLEFFNDLGDVVKNDSEADELAEVDTTKSDDKSSDEGFTELTGMDFPKVESNPSEENAGNAAASTSSMGKHIVDEHGDFPYEPELMAKAVRTMMNKDE